MSRPRESRGIRQAQTLRGDGFITGNHVHDSFRLHPVVGFFHVVEKRTEDGGDGRDRIQLLQARAYHLSCIRAVTRTGSGVGGVGSSSISAAS
jgi:hypothetical protein